MEEVLFNIIRAIIAFFVIVTLIKNYFFLLIAPLYPVREKLRYLRKLQERKQKGLGSFHPKISIVVPAWNEAVGVPKTINSILLNGYDNFELIVVNDGSTDNTDAVVKSTVIAAAKAHPELRIGKKVKYISKKNGGKGKALNAGIKITTGDIILTVDADSALKPGALQNLVKYYLDEDIMAVVGNVEVTNTSSITAFAQRLEYYFGFYNKRAHALLGAEYIFGGACASFRKSVFETIGLFDTENKTEDIEMSMRTKFFGLKSTYAEDVICYTEGASNMQDLISQRIRWKKGRLDTFHKYRTMFFSTEDSHNVFLSFFILPFSILAEVQLIFEPIAIAILIAYSILSMEYLSLAVGIAFILLVFVAVSLFHTNRPRPILLLQFPFIWPLFYVLDWVEFMALYKTLKMIRQGKDVEWQRWNRQGLGKLKKGKA